MGENEDLAACEIIAKKVPSFAGTRNIETVAASANAQQNHKQTQ